MSDLEEFQQVCRGELDTKHSLAEFPNFPWDKLDDKWFSQGGFGVDCNYKPFISLYRENGSIDKWEIPMQLKRLLDRQSEQGERDAQLKMRDALGL